MPVAYFKENKKKYFCFIQRVRLEFVLKLTHCKRVSFLFKILLAKILFFVRLCLIFFFFSENNKFCGSHVIVLS